MNKSIKLNAGQRRKLKNDNLDQALNSSEYLLEDFVELEAQVIASKSTFKSKISLRNTKNYFPVYW